MARTFTAEELSTESGVSVDRIRWMVDVGIIQRRDPEHFNAGDGFRAKMIDALLEAGVSADQIEAAVRIGSLDLSHVDRYILEEPGPRSGGRTSSTNRSRGPSATGSSDMRSRPSRWRSRLPWRACST